MTEPSRIILDYLSDHVMIEWLDDRKLAVLTIYEPSRRNVAIWADTTEGIIQSWNLDIPYAVLHDVQRAILSPYAQKRSKKLLKMLQNRRVRGRYAVLVANNVFGQTIATFVNFTLRTGPNDVIHGQCFTSREAALAWLRDQN